MEELKEIHKVLVAITTLEAAVIIKLREFEYGEMTIKKREGKPYQIVKGGTEILDANSGLELEDAIAIPPGLDISKLNLRQYAGNKELST